MTEDGIMEAWMDVAQSVKVSVQARRGCPGLADRWRLMKGP